MPTLTEVSLFRSTLWRVKQLPSLLMIWIVSAPLQPCDASDANDRRKKTAKKQSFENRRPNPRLEESTLWHSWHQRASPSMASSVHHAANSHSPRTGASCL